MMQNMTLIEGNVPKHFYAPKVQVTQRIFPDGIKTSGQHPPNYEELSAYEEYPGSIDGPTVWSPEAYRNNPERWVHYFSEEEIEELSTAADNFRACGTPLTGIAKVRGTPFVRARLCQ